MKKNTKIIYISEGILTIYAILLTLNISRLIYDTRRVLTAVVLLLVLVMLLAFFGYKKDRNYLKGSSARIVTASLMTFMLIIYGLGIIIGFTKGYMSNGIYSFIKNVGIIAMINIEIELLRYMIVKNSFKSKKTLIIFTIISVIINVLLEINIATLASSEDKFIFLSTIILPIMAGEALCSYMTYKISFLPSLIYKLVIGLYMYVLPIYPDLGNYMYSVAHIVLPFAIYSILNKIMIRYEKEKKELGRVNSVAFTIPLTAFLVVVVLLISGIFKYKMIAIMSNSMSPTYRRGDAIVYEKIDVKKLEIGDILAFRKNNIVMTHRIVEILKRNDKYYFVTKGDNNASVDIFKTEEDQVLGKVVSVYKYIGYPTVLINEFFGKE